MRWRTDGSVCKTLDAANLWEDICDAAWECADLVCWFDDTINEWYTCPEGGAIRASNPCSEYMFLDDTACNLASLNLLKFYNEHTREIRVSDVRHASRLWTIVLEISVLMAQFPARHYRLSYEYRTLGPRLCQLELFDAAPDFRTTASAKPERFVEGLLHWSVVSPTEPRVKWQIPGNVQAA